MEPERLAPTGINSLKTTLSPSSLLRVTIVSLCAYVYVYVDVYVYVHVYVYVYVYVYV